MDETTAWVDARLAAAGLTRTGPLVEHRRRAWADVHTAPSDAGPVWLKVCAPATAFEARLYPLLAQQVPDAVLAPLGVEAERGWVLLPDAGPPLREQFTGAELETAMGRALRRYARAKRTLTPYVDDMLAMGVTDMRPPMLPDRFAAALAAVEPWVDARGGPDARRTYRELHHLRDQVDAWCGELAASPLPASLDHNDLHSNNVVGRGPAADYRARFYDWGDSVIAHPFATLFVPGESSADPAALREAYLLEFTDIAALEQLRETAGLARRLARIARAHTWQRALGTDPLEHEFAHAPFEHLRGLLPGSSP